MGRERGEGRGEKGRKIIVSVFFFLSFPQTRPESKQPREEPFLPAKTERKKKKKTKKKHTFPTRAPLPTHAPAPTTLPSPTTPSTRAPISTHTPFPSTTASPPSPPLTPLPSLSSSSCPAPLSFFPASPVSSSPTTTVSPTTHPSAIRTWPQKARMRAPGCTTVLAPR